MHGDDAAVDDRRAQNPNLRAACAQPKLGRLPVADELCWFDLPEQVLEVALVLQLPAMLRCSMEF